MTRHESLYVCYQTNLGNSPFRVFWIRGFLVGERAIEGELELTLSGGGIQTVNDLIKFKVRSDFD